MSNPRILSPLLYSSQCLRHLPRPFVRTTIRQHTFARTPQRPHSRTGRVPLDPIILDRTNVQSRATRQRRTYYMAAGMLFSMAAMYFVATSIDLPPKPDQLDSARDPSGGILDGSAPLKPLPPAHAAGSDDDDREAQVSTGTSTIPTFPRTLHLGSDGSAGSPATEYQLMGLGVRTVSFLGIQVYVVGLYIATDDIAALQETLMRTIDPVATTLVPDEREKLRQKLLDPEAGDDLWTRVLTRARLRTAVRIGPTRNTDFMHLRDGWVRGITARTQRAAQKGSTEFEDEGFALAMAELKGLFSGAHNRRSLRKGETLLLTRDAEGVLTAWFDEGGRTGLVKMGEVRDERIGRQVWLGYLAGKNVASEAARRSVVDGVMEFVERPVGTVATQVV